jgi:putative GTP pyrophosphokinase
MPELRLSITDEFNRDADTYKALKLEIARLLGELLASLPFKAHSIEARVKSLKSLQRKIGKTPGKYQTLGDLTDVCAARVITYFADQVDEVATIVEREFEIDLANSVDKRKSLDPDRFGYSSLHYIVTLSANRASLPENKRFAGKKVEIQVRSILQHVWAEIEHDRQYQSEEAVPVEIRRRFARLAGLLELADSEFEAIRDETENYRTRTTKKVKTAPNEVAIDSISLSVLIHESEIVKQVDSEISGSLRLPLKPNETPNLDTMISMARVLGIGSVQQLESELLQNRSSVQPFAKKFIASPAWASFPLEFLASGISIVYVLYFALARMGVDGALAALEKVAFPKPGPNLEVLAKELQAALA